MIKACIAFAIVFFTIIILKNLVDPRDTLTVNSTIIETTIAAAADTLQPSSAKKIAA